MITNEDMREFADFLPKWLERDFAAGKVRNAENEKAASPDRETASATDQRTVRTERPSTADVSRIIERELTRREKKRPKK